MSSDYTSSTFASVFSRTKSLRDKYHKLKQQSSGYTGEVGRLKEAGKKDIRIFRQELDTFLDKLEQDVLAELEKNACEEQHRIDEYIATLTAALELLNSDYKSLDTARKDGRKEVMFVFDVKVSRSLGEYESRLAYLEKGYTIPKLSFERDQTLANLQSYIKNFGFLKIKDKEYETRLTYPERGYTIPKFPCEREPTLDDLQSDRRYGFL